MKFTDVNPFSKNEQSKINKSLLSTVKKGDFILGKNVEKFEKKFSKLAKVKYSVGCATGTDALILSIKALGLKKKHEVIIPGLSYISTGLSLALNKTKICFADIDPESWVPCERCPNVFCHSCISASTGTVCWVCRQKERAPGRWWLEAAFAAQQAVQQWVETAALAAEAVSSQDQPGATPSEVALLLRELD